MTEHNTKFSQRFKSMLDDEFLLNKNKMKIITKEGNFVSKMYIHLACTYYTSKQDIKNVFNQVRYLFVFLKLELELFKIKDEGR